MKKIDATVLKETKYIGLWMIIFSLLMQSVFLVLGKWDYSVLLGNLLSGFFGVLNFLLMGITIQNALSREKKGAKSLIKVSQLYRNLMLGIVTAVGVLAPCFNTVSAIIPIFFPRIAIALRPVFSKK